MPDRPVEADEPRVCRDCARPWIYTVEERRFMTSKGFLHPSRCPDCRRHRRREARLEDHYRRASPFE